MKKHLIIFVLFAIACFSSKAEDYNRVTLSYDWQRYSMNSGYSALAAECKNLNGGSINYIHGFGMDGNIFIELGASVNFGIGTEDVSQLVEPPFGEYWYMEREKMYNLNVRIPVNFAYRFNVSDNLKVSPFIGFNFKYNVLGQYKWYLKHDLADRLEGLGYDRDMLESGWMNLYSTKDMGDGNTWTRFQIGWQIGVNFDYKRLSFGVQYGTDFLHAYRASIKDVINDQINSQALKVSVGVNF